MRGPLSAYNALQTKDADTLYFITDAANDKTLLYLGQNLISDSSDTLSPAAKAFLESLPTDENQLNDGDIQVYTIKQEEKEVTDPETGETTTVIETKGEWVTKSIDEVLPLNELAENLSPLILQKILGDDENNINDSYDTIKEISDWILNHPSDAVEINERLLALEEAIGTGQTETEIRPIVDENDNPVYEQLIDEETEKLQYLDIDPETTDVVPLSELEEGQPIYPAYEENPEGDEPPYIPITDPETGEQLYWDLDIEPNLIDEDNENAESKPPAFVQATETVEVEIPNALSLLQAEVDQQKITIQELQFSLNDLTAQFNEKIETLDDLNEIIPVLQEVKESGALEALSNLSSLTSRVDSLEQALTWIDLNSNPENEGG